MDRNVTVFTGTDITSQYQQDVTWVDVRSERDEMLRMSDLWMLADRYAALSGAEQTELTDYRQLLRDLPATYYDATDEDTEGANDAADNFPVAPSWIWGD